VDGQGDKELSDDGGDESKEDVDFDGEDKGDGVSEISRVMFDNIAVGIVPNSDCCAGVR
jgi:hypothetical protein